MWNTFSAYAKATLYVTAGILAGALTVAGIRTIKSHIKA